MSNGHNHDENCDCYFCQNRYARMNNSVQGTLFNKWPKGISPILPNLNSICIPNVKCRSCHEPVFYYCNVNGGSVFFDSLGPTWPKHPCTVNDLAPIPLDEVSEEKKSTFLSLAKFNGWQFVELKNISIIGDEYYKIEVLESKKEIKVLFVREGNIKVRNNRELFSEETICFIKPENNYSYYISMLSEELTIVEALAFINEKDITL